MSFMQDRVEKMLLAANVLLERFGGDVPCVHVSGLNGEGLDQLVETINAVAEMQDVRAEQKDVVQGYVLESKMQKGLGYVLSTFQSIFHSSPLAVDLLQPSYSFAA